MIPVKTEAELAKMRRAGRIAGELLDWLGEAIKPGITTGELDRIAHRFIRQQGATPSFLHYNGYPASICASVNDEVVHGIPGERMLREGDIIGVDVGVCWQGYHGDTCRTYPVGEISTEAARLIRVTEECFFLGADMARSGNRLSDISQAVQVHAEENGYSVVRALTGHGIGKQLHEDPSIPNYGPPGRYEVLKPGMTLAIEPMINQGRHPVDFSQTNGWTVTTRDGGLSSHYEHTVLVTEGEPELLTLSPGQGRREP